MKILKISSIVLLIVALLFFYARSDYTWADRVKEEKLKEGWTLVFEQDNFASLSKPWTLFKTPVTGLWFVMDAETMPLLSNLNIYLSSVLYVRYDYSQTEESHYYELFDIERMKSAMLPAENLEMALTAVAKIPLDEFEWQNYEHGSPGSKLIDYHYSKYGIQ